MRTYRGRHKSRKKAALAAQTALALSIFRELLKHKRVINILPNLQAYFDKRRYFPILMSTFEPAKPNDLITE